VSTEAFVRFPGTPFRSIDEFKRFRTDNRDQFDERYRREQSLAVDGASLTTSGFCAPCLQVTDFASQTHGGGTVDGRWVPHWRLTQTCGCRFALTSHERALLHMALPRLGPTSWTRGGIIGRGDRLLDYLAERDFSFDLWPRLLRNRAGQAELPVLAGSQHMILAADELAHIPALDAALAAIARSLMPGGSFLFSTPFDVEAEESVIGPGLIGAATTALPLFSADAAHRLGWDLMARLRDAGFSDAAAYCYWSEELGYLGPYNMGFLAFR
jgi:hypothetical protein